MTPAVWIGAIAGLATVAAAGNVSLLVQEARRGLRKRRWNTLVLRGLALVSTLVVIGTIGFVRPWYWSIALGVMAIVALFGVFISLRILWRNGSASRRTTLAWAVVAVFFGGFLLTLGGGGGVIDGAALSSDHAEPTWHGGTVLSRPVLYQLFWGAVWSETPTPSAVVQAVAFDAHLARSRWVKSIVSSHFGVSSILDGGCWIDPLPMHASGRVASSTTTGLFPAEVRAVVDHRHPLSGCPGSATTPFPATLPTDAILAVWLPPQVTYELGGIAAHGAVSLPGHPFRLVVAGLPGSYRYWGRPACDVVSMCRSLPSFAPPSYALSHELIESITNPFGNSWYADPPLSWTAKYVLAHGPSSFFGPHPAYQGEVADLCEPSQPDAGGRALVGRLVSGGPRVAAFYRPGVGCEN
jgi:hypothetical protein